MKMKISNVPQIIFLQLGEDIEEDADFNTVREGDITWCTEKVFDSDLEYRLVKKPKVISE